jgi:hypothetical protein
MLNVLNDIDVDGDIDVVADYDDDVYEKKIKED